MNVVRLQQVLSELNAQKEKLRDHYQQTIGAAAIVEKLLKEVSPIVKEATSNLEKPYET